MTTYAGLVEEILDQLQGFTAAPDQIASLTVDISPTDLQFTVDEPDSLSRGLVEIDNEVLWVKSVDQGTATVVLSPSGRGRKGTTAVAHTQGTDVRYAPTWTRSAIRREINRQILAVYPTLYAVKAASPITADATTYQFDLPATAERVVDVRWKYTEVDGWQRARGWEGEHGAPSDFAGGRYVSIYDGIPPGATVQVLYACRPTVLVNDNDDFATVTGLSEGCVPVITLGVQASMARFLDAARLSDQNVQADQLDQPRPISSATNVANDLYRQYQVRLAAEQSALSTRYPARFHRTR